MIVLRKYDAWVKLIAFSVGDIFIIVLLPLLSGIDYKLNEFEFWGVILWVINAGFYRKVYSGKQNYLSTTFTTLKDMAIFLIIYRCTYLEISSYKIMAFYLYSVIGLMVIRFVVIQFLKKINYWWIPAVIFGGNDNSEQLLNISKKNKFSALKVISLIVAPNVVKLKFNPSVPILQWPQTKEDFEFLIDKECLIALEPDDGLLRKKIIENLTKFNIKNVSVIPAMRGVPLSGVSITKLISDELIIIHLNNRLNEKIMRFAKRVFDVVVATVLLIVLIPVFITIGAAIWMNDKGEIFFSQKRIGRGMGKFNLYKFRSMKIDAEEIKKSWEKNATKEWIEYCENNFKLRKDPRVTPVGRFIRKYSLDELPQLINVIKGDMSLVGPRPLLNNELETYGDSVDLYSLISPGVTGLWQVNGRSKTDFTDRVIYDVWYIKNWSIILDLSILLKTIPVVFKSDGAY